MVARRSLFVVAASALAMVAVLAVPARATAADVEVAVASNFAGPARAVAAAFAKDTGHHMEIASGATGKLYAQIAAGAPFDVLLAADDRTPAKLEAEHLAVAGSRVTYAFGKLVLWSAKPGFVDPAGLVLQKGQFAHLAIANPKLAPYGVAAMQVLDALGLTATVQGKLVQGENVAQTAEFVSSGNAELGFVALSQVAPPGEAPVGSYVIVPPQLYSPLRQDAVLLQRAAANPAARALVDYLKGPKARGIILGYGYAIEPPATPAK